MHKATTQTGTAIHSHQCTCRATVAATIESPEVPTLANSHAPCAPSRSAAHDRADILRTVSALNTSHEDTATTPRTSNTRRWDANRLSRTAHAATKVNKRNVTSGSLRSQSLRRTTPTTIARTTSTTRPSVARTPNASLITR